jgi:hypothetical protein
MFCPHCGQQQASDVMRYCSRCGFPLGVISEVLAQGGVLATRQTGNQERGLSPRQRGVRQGAMLMLSAMLIVPVMVFAVLLTGIDGLIPLVPFSAVVCVVGGFIRMAYAFMFEAGAQPTRFTTIPSVPLPPTQFSGPTRGQALPPAQATPVTDWRRRQDTAEIYQPPSVTENTTKLLDRKDEG